MGTIWRFRYSIVPGIIVSALLFYILSTIFFVIFNKFTNDTITQIFDDRILSILNFTILQAFLSTLLSIFFGLLLSWSIFHQKKFFSRDFIVTLFSSSIVLPSLVVVMGIITAFGRNGWINNTLQSIFDYSFGGFIYGLVGILIAHVYLNASFSMGSFLQRFNSIPQERYKLAQSLGLNTWEKFKLIEYPALKDSLLSISSTIFLLCFTSFAIVLTLGGGPSTNTLEVAIYEAIRYDFDIPLALKLAFVQIVISTFLVIVSSNISNSFSNIQTKEKIITYSISTSISYMQKSVILIGVIFFTLPLIAIIIDGLNGDILGVIKRDIFIKSFVTSVLIASLSSIITLIVALSISNLKKNLELKNRFNISFFTKFMTTFISFLSNIYLAIPSLIIGLGFFLMAQNSIINMNIWSGITLICANVLLSLPFALSVLIPIVKKISQRYDRLSFSLNLSAWQRWKYCEYPYLKPSIKYVMALAFCFSIGDLGVIALFGSDNFTTLPWYLYNLMGSYRTHDAAVVALILLVMIFIVFRSAIVRNK